ncbi:putative ribonuclease H-like protein [Lyophyllum shimeji]|uniref:ribonuclease H n=1 Tax=Lyophyllum shimeji TaxID=47721 RepID=A0A9P3PS59_LYOSH|nr:putative ribonuclease H-like protein [Lyophyllum shimeji]
MSLNINGDLALNLLCPTLQRQICNSAVVLFQETHLGPNDHESLDIPSGYQVVSHTRTYRTIFPHFHGGVLALIADNLAVTRRLDLCSPDILVLEFEHFFLVNAYILPEYHKWDSFSDSDPFQKLEDTLMLLSSTGKGLFLMGDLNARTGNHSPLHTTNNPSPRLSEDAVISTRGRALLELCRQLTLDILNGNSRFPGQHSGLTSFHARGSATVDYVIANLAASALVRMLTISPLFDEDGDMISDHAALFLSLNLPAPSHSSTKRKQSKFRFPPLPTHTELDRLLIEVLNSKEACDARKLGRLYGPTYDTSQPISVYIDGSCHGNGTDVARAGAGVYFGPNSSRNMALRVPGAQTNNRGEAYALLKALQVIHTDESISVYSDSLYVIQTITVSAPQHAAQGWRLPNGDIFKDIVRLIQIRTAPICLIQVKGHSGNNHHDQADRLANIGADCPEVPAYQSLLIPLPIPTNRPSLPNLLKVSAKLLQVPVTEKRLTLRADTLSSLNIIETLTGNVTESSNNKWNGAKNL